ncbi:MAG: hypothetical protein ACFFCW_43745 [Candidatus Hodarchaeota archaeon]
MPDPRSNSYNRYRQGLVKRHIVCSGRYLSEMWLKEFDPEKDFHRFLAHKRIFTPPGQDSSRTYIPWVDEHGVVAGGGENPLLRGGILMAAFSIEYLIKKHASSLKYAGKLIDYFESCEATNSSGDRTGFFMRCQHLLTKKEIEQAASTDEIVGLVLGLFYLYRATKNVDTRTNERTRELAFRLGTYLKAYAYFLIPPVGVLTGPDELHRGCLGIFVFQWALERAFIEITGERFRPSQEDYLFATKRMHAILQNEIARDINWSDRRYEKQDMIIATLFLLMKQGRTDPETSAQIHELVARYPYSEGHWYSGIINYYARNLVEWTGEFADLFDIPERLKEPFPRYTFAMWVSKEAIYRGKYTNYFNFALFRHTLLFSLDSSQASITDGESQPVAYLANRLVKIVLTGERDPFVTFLEFVRWLRSEYSVEDLIDILLRQDGDVARTFDEILKWAGLDIPSLTDLVRNPSLLLDILAQIERKILDFFESLQDSDFYAAIIARGLLRRLVEVDDYIERIDEVLEDRGRMSEDLPVGELLNVRNPPTQSGEDQCNTDEYGPHDWRDWALAPVPFHNAPDLASPSARIGTDFCWEHRGVRRVLGSNRQDVTHQAPTGRHACEVLNILKNGRDVMLEGGGLDFFFPRVLMSYFLHEPLDFEDSKQPFLKAVTCLPFAEQGGFKKAVCRPRSYDWLLLSSSML